MSAEKKFRPEVINLSPFMIPEKSEEVSSSRRVDINILLNRVRKEQDKKNRTNFIFLGLIFSLISVVGIILSF